MPAGSTARVALKVQSALNTPATGTYTDTLHDEFDDGPGRLKNTGRPRIGNTSLLQSSAGVVLGARPFAAGRFPLDLNTIGPWLETAGHTVSGAGPYAYAISASTSAAVYGTLDVLRQTSHQYRMRDCKLSRMVLNHPAGDEASVSYNIVGGNLDDSTATHASPSTTVLMPSPAQTISAANATLFGTNSFTILGWTYMIEHRVNNQRQPLGSVTPDDVRSLSVDVRAIAVIDVSLTNWKRVFYGDSGATAVGTSRATGAMKLRLSAPNGTSYIDYDFAAAEYELDAAARIRAEEDQLLVVNIRPIGAVTLTVAL